MPMNKYQQASTFQEIRTSEEVRPLTTEEVDAVAGGAKQSWWGDDEVGPTQENSWQLEALRI